MKRNHVIIAAILLLGVTARLITIGEPYWVDEAISVKQAREPFFTTISLVQSDVHTPLYHAALNAWVHLFNTEPSTVRLLSVTFSAASIYAVYRFGSRYLTETTGLYAAAFLAVSETAIHYGQEARPYSLLILLSIISTYTYLSQRDTAKPNLLAYTGVNVLLLYTHVFGALVLLSHAAHHAYTKGVKQNKLRTELLASYIVTGIAFTPWLPTMTEQVQRATLTWIPELTVAHAVGEYGLLLTSPLALITFIALQVYHRPSSAETQMLYSWAFLPPVVTAAYSLLIRPAFLHRYLLITLPALYLLLAHSVDQINRSSAKHVTGIVLITLLSLSSFIPDNFHRDDWSETITHLEQADDRPILVHPGFEQDPFTHAYNPSCFNAQTMYTCNAEHGIYSVADDQDCCDNDNDLLAINATLSHLTDQELRVINFKTHADTPLLNYLNSTGTLSHEKTLNKRKPRLPMQSKYHHPKLTIHAYQPNGKAHKATDLND